MRNKRKFKQSICVIFATILSLFVALPVEAVDWSRVGNAASGALGEIARHRMQQEEQERQYQLQLELIRQQHELERQRQQQIADEKRAAEEAERQKLEEEKKNAIYTGTGFFVTSNGHIITNAHVVTDRDYVAIRDISGKFYKAEIVARDNQRDLALLRIHEKFPSLRILSSSKVEKGQRVLAVGYPQISIQGNESKVTDGIISSFSGLEGNQNEFQISVPIQAGNSGGPLIDENGNVVGVIVSKLNDSYALAKTGHLPQNVNYAIKSDVLLTFLSEQGIKEQGISGISLKGKKSIPYVDHSTVMVISRNQPLDLVFEVTPEELKQANFIKQLEKIEPDYSLYDTDSRFHAWMEEVDSNTGRPRRETFKTAQAAGDVNKVAAYFMEFKKEAYRLQLGTVTDRKTGLVWQQEDDSIKRTWEGAKEYCANLELAGFNSWRLPSKEELQSLVVVRSPPTVDTSLFPECQPANYWSSTENTLFSAWLVSFYSGDVNEGGTASDYKNYVRCVR